MGPLHCTFSLLLFHFFFIFQFFTFIFSNNDRLGSFIVRGSPWDPWTAPWQAFLRLVGEDKYLLYVFGIATSKINVHLNAFHTIIIKIQMYTKCSKLWNPNLFWNSLFSDSIVDPRHCCCDHSSFLDKRSFLSLPRPHWKAWLPLQVLTTSFSLRVFLRETFKSGIYSPAGQVQDPAGQELPSESGQGVEGGQACARQPGVASKYEKPPNVQIVLGIPAGMASFSLWASRSSSFDSLSTLPSLQVDKPHL